VDKNAMKDNSLDRERQLRLAKYLIKCRDFADDYRRFVETHTMEEEIKVLQQNAGKKISDLPKSVLDRFLERYC
jgi:hypothetical protein